MPTDKDLQRVLDAAKKQGFQVIESSNNHARIFTADGEFVTGVASTPSDYRGQRNMLSRLRRYGFLSAS